MCHWKDFFMPKRGKSFYVLVQTFFFDLQLLCLVSALATFYTDLVCCMCLWIWAIYGYTTALHRTGVSKAQSSYVNTSDCECFCSHTIWFLNRRVGQNVASVHELHIGWRTQPWPSSPELWDKLSSWTEVPLNLNMTPRKSHIGTQSSSPAN